MEKKAKMSKYMSLKGYIYELKRKAGEWVNVCVFDAKNGKWDVRKLRLHVLLFHKVPRNVNGR